jgi:hypothetical protein
MRKCSARKEKLTLMQVRRVHESPFHHVVFAAHVEPAVLLMLRGTPVIFGCDNPRSRTYIPSFIIAKASDGRHLLPTLRLTGWTVIL